MLGAFLRIANTLGSIPVDFFTSIGAFSGVVVKRPGDAHRCGMAGALEESKRMDREALASLLHGFADEQEN